MKKSLIALAFGTLGLGSRAVRSTHRRNRAAAWKHLQNPKNELICICAASDETADGTVRVRAGVCPVCIGGIKRRGVCPVYRGGDP